MLRIILRHLPYLKSEISKYHIQHAVSFVIKNMSSKIISNIGFILIYIRESTMKYFRLFFLFQIVKSSTPAGCCSNYKILSPYGEGVYSCEYVRSNDAGFLMAEFLWPKSNIGTFFGFTSEFVLIWLRFFRVPTTKSLRFAIFWEIFENCQLKTLLNSKIVQIVTVFLKILA